MPNWPSGLRPGARRAPRSFCSRSSPDVTRRVMRKSDIDTPALILDLDLVEHNIAMMAAYFRSRPQKLRPHFKTPKTPEIARRQLAAGAIGITAAKLGEVEVLAKAGLGPILLA